MTYKGSKYKTFKNSHVLYLFYTMLVCNHSETSVFDGYTIDWSNTGENESISSYRVESFRENIDEDFGFQNPTPKIGEMSQVP